MEFELCELDETHSDAHNLNKPVLDALLEFIDDRSLLSYSSSLHFFLMISCRERWSQYEYE